MPTERCFNLPEEKKQRVLDAAAAEFSRVPFDQVSINQIIQSAGIPRGSFYQYFEDKLDLLGYLLRDFCGEAEKAVLTVIRETDGDIFVLFRTLLSLTVEYGFRTDYRPMFQNIFPHMKLHSNRELFPYFHVDLQNPFKYSEETTKEVLQTILHSRHYTGVPRRDLLDMMELLVALLQYTVSQIFYHMELKDSICESFDNKLAILKRGLTGKEARHVEIQC